MISLHNVSFANGQQGTFTLNSQDNLVMDASGLTLLPAVIDPHVHFRTPGMAYKEDWRTAAKAAICGGCTTVFDMPNTLPPTITAHELAEKKSLIDQQLAEVGIPLRYELFFGADKKHFSEIPKIQSSVIGIKVFMGCSTGNLVIDDDESLHAVFAIAAELQMLVAVHAEDETILRTRRDAYQGVRNYAAHSMIRSVEAATTAVAKAIKLCKLYGTRLYILHVSTAEEIALIKQAKQEGLPVYAETTPHHLFFNDSAYEYLEGRAVVNPPLRAATEQSHLFAAIKEGVIDTIGSDHAPHTLAEKSQPYGQCPSGMPGIEFVLPLLLTAEKQGLLTLDHIIGLTSKHAQDIFKLPVTDDYVLVDRNRVAPVTQTHSKCGWSPYMGMILQGWPVYTILRGRCISVGECLEAPALYGAG